MLITFTSHTRRKHSRYRLFLQHSGSHKQESRPGGWPRRRLVAVTWGLFGDAVRPLASGVLRRLDPLTCFTAQQGNEAAHGVRLPARCFPDLVERHTLGALHHRDHLRLLVAALAPVPG